MMGDKGPGFERDVSKWLSLWWSKGKRDDIYWRTAASGGRATQRGKKGKRTKYQYGDITFTDPEGMPLINTFLVEAKRGYTNTSKPLMKKDLDKACRDIRFSKEDHHPKVIRRLFSKTKKSTGVSILNIIDGDRDDDKEDILKWWKKATIEKGQGERKHIMLIFRRDSKQACMCVDQAGFTDLFSRYDVTFRYAIIAMDDKVLFIFRLQDFFDTVKPIHIKKLDLRWREKKHEEKGVERIRST